MNKALEAAKNLSNVLDKGHYLEFKSLYTLNQNGRKCDKTKLLIYKSAFDLWRARNGWEISCYCEGHTWGRMDRHFLG